MCPSGLPPWAFALGVLAGMLLVVGAVRLFRLKGLVISAVIWLGGVVWAATYLHAHGCLAQRHERSPDAGEGSGSIPLASTGG